MSKLSRRAAIKQVAFAAGIATAGLKGSLVAFAAPPSPETGRIKGLTRRDETIVRVNMIGSGFATTWAADGRQYLSLSEGTDLKEPPTELYHARVFALDGVPPQPTVTALPGYPHMPMRFKESAYASFWAEDCLAVDGVLYQLLSTTNHPYFKSDGGFWPGFRTIGAKIIYSPDNGVTWHNQDGTHPVVWENWNGRSSNNMLFYDEEVVSGTFLQMGRNYRANRDGYVYLYSCNPELAAAAAEQVILMRVAKSKVMNRKAYEFFGGNAHGKATWTRDIKKRAPVHTFPEGWVSRSDKDGMVPMGWALNVVYNEPLGLYMMAAQGMGVGASGVWFGKPSYLGFWVASTPWGPFRQIHEETAWTPANDRTARAWGPHIPSKWISPDGKSFWLIWSDYAYQGSAGEVENPDQEGAEKLRHITDDRELARAFKEWTRKHQPNALFNMQRVDLI